MRALRFIFLLVIVSAVTCWGEPKTHSWERIPDCVLVENPWNDGDSFHIRAKGKERIFRLYYVDCPEVEATYPARVKAQAKYFGVSVESILRIGGTARDYSMARLRSQPFTVWTRWEDAEGNSKLKRYFAWIELDNNQNLAADLAQNGYARVYGKSTPSPAGETAKATWKKLDALEAEARKLRRGVWLSSQLPAVREENGKRSAPVGAGGL